MELKPIALAALLLGLASSLQALTFSYEVGNGSSVTANQGSGLIIQTEIDDNLRGTSFLLDDGQSKSFDFFSIWTDETDVGRDDVSERTITATLDFIDPLTSATVNGITYGGSIILAEWGKVEWDGPAYVNLLDRSFMVELNDAVFNRGLFGLLEGECYGATIVATVTQTGSKAVPEGGTTVALLGLGLVGLVGMRRRLA